jgi:spermidine synthase
VGALMKANLFGLLFLPLLDHLAGFGRGVIEVAILMVYLVARSWGALLPGRVWSRCRARAGRRTRVVYFANSLGAAAAQS